jgi:hypothetical protein
VAATALIERLEDSLQAAVPARGHFLMIYYHGIQAFELLESSPCDSSIAQSISDIIKCRRISRRSGWANALRIQSAFLPVGVVPVIRHQ